VRALGTILFDMTTGAPLPRWGEGNRSPLGSSRLEDLAAILCTSQSSKKYIWLPRESDFKCYLRRFGATGVEVSAMANRCLSPRTKIIPSEIAGVAISTSPIVFEASNSY